MKTKQIEANSLKNDTGIFVKRVLRLLQLTSRPFKHDTGIFVRWFLLDIQTCYISSLFIQYIPTIQHTIINIPVIEIIVVIFWKITSIDCSTREWNWYPALSSKLLAMKILKNNYLISWLLKCFFKDYPNMTLLRQQNVKNYFKIIPFRKEIFATLAAKSRKKPVNAKLINLFIVLKCVFALKIRSLPNWKWLSLI